MTPKVGDTVKCGCGCDGTPFVVAAIAGDRAESADGMRSAYVSKCVVVKPSPVQETPPVAKKATAAELRANFAHYYCSVHASHGCTQPCDWLAELDVLLAAARAEAVADAGDDAVELREALLSLSARPDDPNRPHINDIIGACIRAARAEAVAPLEARVAELESERGALVEADILRRARVGEVLDVLRQFVEAMPKCEWDEYECKEVATRHAYKQQFFCSAHQFASDVQPVEWAAPLRAALALLAEHKEGT